MVDMPFAPGFNQGAYADKLLEEHRGAEIAPSRIYPQSFNPDDIWHWINNHPDFADQAIWLGARRRRPSFQSSTADFAALQKQGLKIIAPPIPMLLALNHVGRIVPSAHARKAKSSGLEIITWTFEAGDPMNKKIGFTRLSPLP